MDKMWQPLNVNSRQLRSESKLSVVSSLLFDFLRTITLRFFPSILYAFTS